MDIERIIEIIESNRRVESSYDDTFERGEVIGTNEAIDNIVMELQEEEKMKESMVALIEDMQFAT